MRLSFILFYRINFSNITTICIIISYILIIDNTKRPNRVTISRKMRRNIHTPGSFSRVDIKKKNVIYMRYIIGLIGILLTLMVIPGVLAQGVDNTGMNLQPEGSGGFINDNEGNIYHEQTVNQGWIGNGKDYDNNQNLDQIIRILKGHGIDTSQLEIAIKSGNMAIVQSLLSRYQNLINEGINRIPGQDHKNPLPGQNQNQNPLPGQNQDHKNPLPGQNQNQNPLPGQNQDHKNPLPGQNQDHKNPLPGQNQDPKNPLPGQNQDPKNLLQ